MGTGQLKGAAAGLNLGWALVLRVLALATGHDGGLSLASLVTRAALAVCVVYQLRTIDMATRGGGERAAGSHWLDVAGASAIALGAALVPLALLDILSPRALAGWNVLAPVFISSSRPLDMYRSDLAAVTGLASVVVRSLLSLLAFAMVAVAGPRGVVAVVGSAIALLGVVGSSPLVVALRLLAATMGAAVAWSAYVGGRGLADGQSDGHSPPDEDDGPRDAARISPNLPVSSDDGDLGAANSSWRTRETHRAAALVLAIAVIRWGLTPATLNLSVVGTSGPDQWIVFASADPAASVTLPDLCERTEWQVVALATTATPANWTLPGCHILSIRDQRRLPLRIAQHLPWRSEVRKSLGYAYAIAAGARVILDLEDGIVASSLSAPTAFDAKTMAISTNASITLNVYEHFGRSDLWPRGYPLGRDFGRPHSTLGYLDNATYLGELNGRVLVQQSLIDVTPDVDSLSITTRAETSRVERLCSTAPALQLARGTMTPIGSRHTLWHRDAFWALLLPLAVDPGWSDIVRGYIAQRLLWDVGGTTAVSDAFAKTVLSSSRPTLIDELRSAQRVDSLIAELHAWSSDALSLPQRIAGLTSSLRVSGHASRSDVALTGAWLDDLADLAYAFPSVSPWSAFGNAEAARLATPQPAHATALAASHVACSSKRVSFDDTLLIIVWNSPLYQYLDRFESLYSPYFPHRAHYGNLNVPFDDRVTQVDIGEGELGYRALEHAYEHRPGFKSYLYTNDDCGLNPYALATLNPDHFWLSSGFVNGFGNWPIDVSREIAIAQRQWWVTFEPNIRRTWYEAYNAVPERPYRERARAASPWGRDTMYGHQNDFFHLPARLAPEFMSHLAHFSKGRVWHEVVFGTIIRFFEPNETAHNIPASGASWLWGGSRGDIELHLVPTKFVIHPIKLSSAKLIDAVLKWHRLSEQWY